MKKLYIFILFCISSYFAKAQYTLTGTTNPMLGDIEYTRNADTITPMGYYPVGGTNQIWNFTGIVVSQTTAVKSSSFVSVSSAPNASLFTSANLAKTDDGQNYEMNNYSNSGVVGYGSSNNTLTILYQNPETIAYLPFTYGNISTDTYSASYTNSLTPVSRTGTVTTTADAWGTLNLPGGASKSFANTLRVKLQLNQIENAGSAYSQTLIVNGYVYFNSTSKWSVLSVNVATVTTQSGTNTPVTGKFKSVEVGEAAFTGINETQDQASNFSLYPNPSANTVNLWFVLTGTESYDMTITNSLGQIVRNKVYENLSPGAYNLDVDLKGLQSGIYYVRLKGNKQEGVRKLIIE